MPVPSTHSMDTTVGDPADDINELSLVLKLVLSFLLLAIPLSLGESGFPSMHLSYSRLTRL